MNTNMYVCTVSTVKFDNVRLKCSEHEWIIDNRTKVKKLHYFEVCAFEFDEFKIQQMISGPSPISPF